MTLTEFIVLDTVRTLKTASVLDVADCTGLVCYEAEKAIRSLIRQSFATVEGGKAVVTKNGNRGWRQFYKSQFK